MPRQKQRTEKGIRLRKKQLRVTGITSLEGYQPHDLPMPAGLKRYYGSGDLHFITCSCYQRRKVLDDPSRRNLLLGILEQVRRRYRFVILGYVVMPEHFHLLITEPQVGTPSTVMQVFKQRFARRVRKELLRAHAHGQFRLWKEEAAEARTWQPRFYDFNVRTEGKRLEKLRYMHRNPVKRGLVSAPEQWAWSSFRSHFCGESGLVGVNDCTIMTLKTRLPAA
jgi:putative transposase